MHQVEPADGPVLAEVLCAPVGVRGKPVTLDGTAGFVQNGVRMGVWRSYQQKALWVDNFYEFSKGRFHVVQVAENIRMVELHTGQDGGVRPVMQELGALVEKSGVVFVPFGHEHVTFGNPVIAVEVFQPAAHHESRFGAAVVQHPGQQRGGGGFSVRPGDHERFAIAEKEPVQSFGKRGVGNFLFEHRLHFLVGFGNGVADDDEIDVCV